MSDRYHIRADTTPDSPHDQFIARGCFTVNRPTRARTIDLSGYRLSAGMVNAHDHLELNHFPRTKFREVYDNAHQWGDDVDAQLNQSPYFDLRQYRLADRLFIGGLKNLLCGATTVAQHGAPHRMLFSRDFPVTVLRRYGWAHSLHFSTEEEIVTSYRRTPPTAPWFIHLAEGTDALADGEYQRLKALGCIGANTVIVHGVGLSEADIDDASRSVRGLVWCPSTNQYLLGASAHIAQWHECGGTVALGSDSRLTADGDLGDEISAGITQGRTQGITREQVMVMVGVQSARLLGLSDVGHLRAGAHADFVVNWHPQRSRIALIVRGGIPQIGDPALMAHFPDVQTVACQLDGVEKRLNSRLARRIHRSTLKEQGLEVAELPSGKRFFFF
ncbi:MAG: amidohydrolase family protein [Anaerolineae bacterium]